MANVITKELLGDLGIALPAQSPEDEATQLANLNASLDERVGLDIMGAVGPDNVERVTELAQAGDQAGIAALVETAARENGEQLTLQDIIDSEVDMLLGELVEGMESDDTEEGDNSSLGDIRNEIAAALAA
jgi:hypothetical protein